MKKYEASYTVEIAMLAMVIMLTLFLPIYAAYDLYEETKQASVSGWDNDFSAETKIRMWRLAEKT